MHGLPTQMRRGERWAAAALLAALASAPAWSQEPHLAYLFPAGGQRGSTFRDVVRRDNIVKQREKFVLRGILEEKALQKARHIIGRTDWDLACVRRINPEAKYHFCNETLRQPFYQGTWRYESCRKHRIFASSCAYPVKGFHYLLEAFGQIVKLTACRVAGISKTSRSSPWPWLPLVWM